MLVTEKELRMNIREIHTSITALANETKTELEIMRNKISELESLLESHQALLNELISKWKP